MTWKCNECGNVTLTLSWSRLRSSTECKAKGHLQGSGKRLKVADQRVFFPGNVVDRTMRDWLNNDPYNNKGMMPEMVTSIIDREEKIIIENGEKMLWKNSSDRTEVTKMCIEAVKKLEPHLEELVLPYEYEPDMSFSAPWEIETLDGSFETILLRGFMDVLVRDPKSGLWMVYDLKITRDSSYWKKTIGQLIFYSTAVQFMFGDAAVETGLIQPLAKPEFFPYTVTEDDLSHMRQRIIRLANEIWRKEYPPNLNREFCHNCDVKHACSKFKPVNFSLGSEDLLA